MRSFRHAQHVRQVRIPRTAFIVQYLELGLRKGQSALGFAHASGPEQRQRASAIQQSVDLSQLMLATDQGVQGGRKAY
jgi:hypothetical protein